MGEVIALPVVRTCFVCEHHIAAGAVTRCQLFDEPVDSELYAARHCPYYEPA